MRIQINLKHILLTLLLLVTIVLFCKPYQQKVFAASPSFVRQEIADGLHDVIKINDCDRTIVNLNPNSSKSNAMFDGSLDIQRVSYLSDGNVLNATIWLREGFASLFFKNSSDVNFGILVDVNPNPTLFNLRDI